MRRVWLVGVCVSLAGCAGADAQSRDPALAGQAPARADGREDAAPERRADASLHVQRGLASYYADSLAGNPTASGEPYDPTALTAASRELPFGTRVRVVREDTGAAVVVRVNDRGPFGDDRRILDLSRAAAERLDMIRAGVVGVRAEILERPGG
ncbi:MAG TPA: septal ring lytic transglycosylase RlpA family protein [Sandaracinaceae bacterium LLY-WYZ-13_1]|nr:septal ring lytic transglycosylase RlpA family protein [Sandaracinaceae bacterium LLY-WYZ-13_1]